jgi:hypothetical protein
MHQRIHVIEGWGSQSHIRNVVGKIGEDNQKVRQIGQAINQAFALGPEHDNVWAQWASYILLKNMLERV